MRPPSTLFRVPLVLPLGEAKELHSELGNAWKTQHKTVPAGLISDLERLMRLFNPNATGATVRRLLEDLPLVSLQSPHSSDTLLIPIDPTGRGVVTPEGRVLYEVLSRRIPNAIQGRVEVGDGDASGALNLLHNLYEGRVRHRLLQVAKLQRGEGGALHPWSAGLLLVLLVNRSTSSERAIVRPRDAALVAEVDAAIRAPVVAFADAVSPSSGRRQQHLSLYSGYALTEARRRFKNVIHLEDDRLYLEEAAAQDVVDFIAKDLRRRGVDLARVADAFDNLVEAYRSVKGKLALLGSAFERPSDTSRLRELFLSRFESASS